MDEAIGQVDGGAGGFTGSAEGIPFGAAEYLVDQHARFMHCAGFWVNGCGQGLLPARDVAQP
jgi:hypothetical protein